MELRILAPDAVDEVPIDAYPLVNTIHQAFVRPFGVSQNNLHAFIFGDVDGGNKIAVAGDQNSLINRAAHTQAHQLNCQQDVYLLLLKNGRTIRVDAAMSQTAQANVEIRQAAKIVVKFLSAGKPLLFLFCRRIALPGLAGIVINAKQLMRMGKLRCQFLVIYFCAIELITQDSIQIPGINENNDFITHGIKKQTIPL